MKYVSTRYMLDELEKAGINYADPTSRICVVAQRQGIKAVKRIGKRKYWNLGDARKIVAYIIEGYKKPGRRPGSVKKNRKRKKKTKNITIKPSYSTRKIELLEDSIKDLEWSIKNYKGAIEELNDRISFLEDQNILLRQENELLKQPKKEEKRRKFWFF